MRVVAAAIVPLHASLRRPLATARGVLAARAGFVLRLTADSGAIGEGEASPAYWISAQPRDSLAATAADLRRVVAFVATGPRPAELRATVLADARLAPAAAAAIDAALLDLEGRTRGVAVADLLGREVATVGALAAAALVDGESADAVAVAGARAVARGFGTVKLKVGSAALAADVRRVAALRERVGPAVALRLDANRAWAPESARAALAALAPFEPAFVEEPLRDGDPRALAALARGTRVPLAVDESIVHADDLAAMLATGAPFHVVLKAARVGGPTRLVALARRAHAAGLPVVVTDSIEGSVGMAAAVHAAAALPGAHFAVGLGGAQLLAAVEPGGSVESWGVPAVTACGPGVDVATGVAPREAAAGA